MIEINSILNKISFLQLFSLSLLSIICLLIKEYTIFSAILITGIASFSYTQLIRLGSHSKLFAFLGFPIRLILVAPPCAILVHKLHSNLIALYFGFVISQIIYFLFIWSYIKNLKDEARNIKEA